MAEKTGYTYYADPQQVDFTLRMTVPALANEVLNTAGSLRLPQAQKSPIHPPTP